MENNKEKHPSYGMLQFSRTHGHVAPLFGSSIKHGDTIRMYLREGTVERHLNSDYYFGGDKIAEVEMSFSQFAEVIGSMNQGSGVPVTIRYTKEYGVTEECPFTDKKTQLEDEFANDLAKKNELANALIDTVNELFDEKKTLNKSDKEKIMSLLRKLKMEIGVNTEFVYNMFNEQMDKTVMEAKGEIEAFMQNKIHTIANMALVENRDKLELTGKVVEI